MYRLRQPGSLGEQKLANERTNGWTDGRTEPVAHVVVVCGERRSSRVGVESVVGVFYRASWLIIQNRHQSFDTFLVVHSRFGSRFTEEPLCRQPCFAGQPN